MQLRQNQTGLGVPPFGGLQRVGPPGKCEEVNGAPTSQRLVECPKDGRHQPVEFGPSMDSDSIIDNDGHRDGALSAELAHEPCPIARLRRPVEQAQAVAGHVGSDSLEIAKTAARARGPGRRRTSHLRWEPDNRLRGTNRSRVDDADHHRSTRTWGAEEAERVVGPATLRRELENTATAGRDGNHARLGPTRTRVGHRCQCGY